MKQVSVRIAALVCVVSLLGACASLDALSFGGSKERDTTRPPAGATSYQCDGGKRLFVRFLDNGAAAWVILPDREFRLEKSVSASGSRYSNGIDTLDTEGGEATLRNGSALSYAKCKTGGG